MARGHTANADDFTPLLQAMSRDGGEWPADKVREFLGIDDRKNLARAVKFALEHDLMHRRRSGPKAFYIVGPDPTSSAYIGKFNAVVYLDGTLNMSGVSLDEEGDPLLNRAQAAALKRLLNGTVL